MLTIDVIYAPTTRQISLPHTSDFYGGATIDSNSVEISVTGIDAAGFSQALNVRVDFAVNIQTEDRKTLRPFILLEKDGDVWRGTIPTSVLSAAAKTRKLPFQLVLKDGDTVINSRNTLTMEVTRAIDALGEIVEAYKPYIMFRDESWAWQEDFTYKVGSVVTYNGLLYVSLIDDNRGNVPHGKYDGDDGIWRLTTSGDMAVSTLGDGVHTSFDVVHGLGTTNVSCSVQRNGAVVFPTVAVVDEDTVSVRFSNPPAVGSIKVTVYAGGVLNVPAVARNG